MSVPFGNQDMADRIVAAADLVSRMGASQFEIGYIHEDRPMQESAWYAHAQYRGARVIVDEQSSPMDAAEGLARRLLTGARCGCGRKVVMERLGKAGECRWRREGAVWVSACGRGAVRSPKDAR
jgi:hypothetical protein